jgi:hypothetical protein
MNTEIFELIVKQWANDGIHIDNYAITSKNVKITLLEKEIHVTDPWGTRHLNIEYELLGKQEITDIVESVLVLIHRTRNLEILRTYETKVMPSDRVYRFHNLYYNEIYGGKPHIVSWNGNWYALDGTHRLNRAFKNEESLACIVIEAKFDDFEIDYYNLFSEYQLDTE